MKMAEQGRSDFCVVFTTGLCVIELKTNVNKFGISNHTALKFAIQVLRSYLNQTCKYELHTLSNTKVSAAKGHGENYMKVRPPLVRHL